MDPVQAWEAMGSRIETEHGRVWWCDLPAHRDTGRAPALVLHGFPTCSFDWRHVIEPLRTERRVVMLDFLGFGLSDKPDTRYSIRLHADCAEAVVRALALDEVALVTHDMGDTVGGELLARDLEGRLPFAITERVLSNGSIYIEMAQLSDGQQMLLGLDDARFDLASIGMDPGTGFRAGVGATFSPAHPASGDELDAQWSLAARADGHTLLARTIRYIEDRRAEEHRFTGAIEKHPAPLGVIWGEEDPIAVVAMVDRLLAARPDTPAVRLPGVGHYPMIEAPEPFADALVGMLS